MTTTAFVCSVCGNRAEAQTPNVYRLWMSGRFPIKCANCFNLGVDYSSMTKEEYLKTQRWKDLSKECKKLAGWRCQTCYANGPLHAHHRVYDRWGNELQTDLTALCNPCHTVITARQKGLLDVTRLQAQLDETVLA